MILIRASSILYSFSFNIPVNTGMVGNLSLPQFIFLFVSTGARIKSWLVLNLNFIQTEWRCNNTLGSYRCARRLPVVLLHSTHQSCAHADNRWIDRTRHLMGYFSRGRCLCFSRVVNFEQKILFLIRYFYSLRRVLTKHRSHSPLETQWNKISSPMGSYDKP